MRRLIRLFPLVIATACCLVASASASHRSGTTAPAATEAFVNADVRDRIDVHHPCEAAVVKHLVLRLLGAFNAGRSRDFVAEFLPGPRFSGYGYRHGIGGDELARFVARRHGKGDGWTALELYPPLGHDGSKLADGTLRRAVYGLELRVSRHGRTASPRSGVKLVVSCSSGRIAQWVGLARPE